MLLAAHGLDFTYPGSAGAEALRGVSIKLSAGEVVAVLGPNGSGKSTLIRALLGQHKARGEILWEGRPLKAWAPRELARRVAYLPQSPTFDPEQTVADVLRLGRAPYWRGFGLESPDDDGVIRSAAARLELDGLLSRPVGELSGGQRQRALVGRCLAQQPAAMLLDEPNTYLDLRHQVDLLRVLRDLSRDSKHPIGVLMASHDLNLAGAFADRIMLLERGAVVAEGPPNRVVRAELISRVYGLPMREIASEKPGDAPIVVPVVD